MTITIRRAESNDVSTIAAFNQAMAMETEGKELPDATITEGVRSFLARPEYGFYLVAEAKGTICGCLMVTYEWSDWRNGLFWWIQSVYVSPEFRRMGVFRTLYDTVSKQAEQTVGVCGLRLYVERDNRIAQSTYARMGMEETHYRIFERVIPGN